MKSDKTTSTESTTNGGGNWDELGRDCTEYKKTAETLSHIDDLESLGSLMESASKNGDTAVGVAAMDRYNEIRAEREQADGDEDDETEVATDGGEDEQAVFIVVRDLSEKDWTYPATVVGVYTTREAAEAHAEDIESAPGDEWAKVVEQTVKTEFANGGNPEPVVMTDGGIDTETRTVWYTPSRAATSYHYYEDCPHISTAEEVSEASLIKMGSSWRKAASIDDRTTCADCKYRAHDGDDDE